MDAKTLLSQIASRIETILAKEEDPQQLMREIAATAEAAGIVDEAENVRTDSPLTFTMDLLTENPRAFEWAQIARETLRPLQINSRSDLLDALSPQ